MEAFALTVAEKNPVFVQAGKRGALKRWGEPRTVKIGDLTVEQRRLVVALVDAAKAGKVASDAT